MPAAVRFIIPFFLAGFVTFGLFWLMRMLRTHGELVTQEEGNLGLH